MSESTIAIVILAAGGSRRMGSPKQLLTYQGRTLIRHVTETALAAGIGPVAVVVGACADRVRAEVMSLPVEVVLNQDWEQGMSSSLRAGLAAVQNISAELAAVLLLVGDQPLVSAALFHLLVQNFVATGKSIVACSYAKTIGVPALFARSLFPEIMALQGDKGAKAIVQRYAGETVIVPFPEGAIDVDTAEDYRKLLFANR